VNEKREAYEDRVSVDRVLAGDTAAFEQIVRRWQGPLVNLAWRFCRDRGRAEELAQEAFLRTYRNLNQWRRDAAFSTWLFALALNVYRSELKRIPAAMLSLDEIVEPADLRILNKLDQLEEADQSASIRRAVLALPEKYRDAILIYYFHEQDVPTAALTLGIPEGTVKARLFRGRNLLRKKFSQAHSASRATPLSAPSPKEA